MTDDGKEVILDTYWFVTDTPEPAPTRISAPTSAARTIEADFEEVEEYDGAEEDDEEWRRTMDAEPSTASSRECRNESQGQPEPATRRPALPTSGRPGKAGEETDGGAVFLPSDGIEEGEIPPSGGRLPDPGNVGDKDSLERLDEKPAESARGNVGLSDDRGSEKETREMQKRDDNGMTEEYEYGDGLPEDGGGSLAAVNECEDDSHEYNEGTKATEGKAKAKNIEEFMERCRLRIEERKKKRYPKPGDRQRQVELNRARVEEQKCKHLLKLLEWV
eukprot:CAMPEP_0119128070 /NCGR_PEP_ID=MMETSP1310-20130426/6372_1 /TAXON_ID=464262 /ORGANISM="Genus nov. species nov., Strain RCC2339" /LENGTH=275 /DNA_ID=CAMNT_0007118377 /DNA_START=159 /DNA_END=983 /DNA_ORIENTATION=+